jgi:hypothetical protein
MPIHSRRNERSARRCAWPGRVLFTLCAALVVAPARGHEPGADALPGAPGWRLGAAVAAVLPRADAGWPTASWPGVLVDGSAPRDQRAGLRLEHATLDLAARFDERLGAALAIGWHDRESAHVEAAHLQGDFEFAEGHLGMRLGRDTVRMGAVIDGAGHLDLFSQAPLARRAVNNSQWIDDGLSLSWRRDEADGLRAAELGAWRGRVFPGGASGPAVPSLHLHGGWGHLDAHLALAHFHPTARGAAAQSAGSVGHVHGTLDCRASLQQRVCFDGSVDVAGTSLQWAPEGAHWSVAVAGLMRREHGALYSPSGDATLRSTLRGAWADLAWRPDARWTLATRVERLVPSNHLEGFGTVLLAGEAGLDGGAAIDRISGAALVDVHATLQLALEAGRERSARGAVSHVALRAIWRNPRWLGGSW